MIDIRNLTFGYKKRALLFQALNLHLSAGSIYGLLGKNGAGKSSLLQLMQGLSFPKSGEVEILGYHPRKRHPTFLADCFSVPEELYFPNLSIQAFRGLYAPFYPKFDREQFVRLLYEFELDHKGHFRRLSMGQKKKVMLAFGLATNARILLLDEPTNGLDIPSKKQFRSILAREITDERLFILSTHQIRDLQSLIDTVLILENGQILFQESVTEIMERLHFTVSYREPQDSAVLYYERVPGGYFCIQEAGKNDSLEVDIEILFNAITCQADAFHHLFNLEGYAK